MMAKVIKAPERTFIRPSPSVFLCGSIEMGKAVDWQTELTEALEDLRATILNPRRDDWDSSWKQSINNDQFREQVTWELRNIHAADIIVVNFDPKTKSPITLMELGLVAVMKKTVIVCCPEGFYRKGNVDVFCYFHHLIQVDTLEDLIRLTRERVESFNVSNIQWKK